MIATFRPKRTDDLRPGASEWIGRTLIWQCLWLIGTHESRAYGGEFAFAPRPENPLEIAPFAWVPERDLEIKRLL